MKDTLTIIMVIIVGVVIVSMSTEENIVKEIILGEESTEENMVREFVRVEKIKDGVQSVKNDLGIDKVMDFDLEEIIGSTENQFADLTDKINYTGK